jgi:hypothetical protein
VWQASALVSDYAPQKLVITIGLAALMVAARYEGLFVVAAIALLLAANRRLSAAIAVVAAGSLPMAAMGFWSLSRGWFFLPASILMKQTVLGDARSSLLSSVTNNVAHSEAPAAFVTLLIAALLLIVFQARTARRASVYPPLVIFVVASLLHLAFAKFGYLFRYESYLMVLGSLAVGIASLRMQREQGTSPRGAADIATAVALVVVLIFGSRTLGSNAVVANMAGHIYRQQFQLARFLGRYYDRRPVALNDIGAVTYYTRVRVRDLMGLSSLDVARLRRSGLWDADHLNELLHRDDVGVAAIYDSWFHGDRAFQREWQRVGAWVTDVEEEPGEGTVTFFAKNTAEAETLRAALREFNGTLPAGEVSTRIFDARSPDR